MPSTVTSRAPRKFNRDDSGACMYDRLTRFREPFLNRARENAKLTIPSLMPEEGHTQDARMYEPYQGLGAMGVTTLSSKLLMAMLPPGRPHLKLDLPAEVKLQAIAENAKGSEMQDIQKKFAMFEEMIRLEIELSNWRSVMSAEFQQLLVAGNVLEYIQEDNNLKVYRLDQYVVVRDYSGNQLLIIVQERMSPRALPENARELLDANKRDSEEDVSLYTIIERGTEEYEVWQEINEKEVPDTRGSFAFDELPYNAVRYSEEPGEDYGRSKIEEHAADLRTLEALWKSQTDGVALMSRYFMMLRPTNRALALRRNIIKAPNGDVIIGDPEAIQFKQPESLPSMQQSQAMIEILERRLEKAFMMATGVQRDAERVTAAEFTTLVDELEEGLGGVFSVLSRDMMLPRTKILLNNMKDQDKLPKWGKQDVVPQILTGLEALARERKVANAVQAINIAATIPGADTMADFSVPINAAWTGLGFPDAVFDAEEQAQRRQEKEQLQAMTQLAGQLSKEGGQA